MKGDQLPMGTVPQLPTKVKFMMELSFPMIRKLFPRKPFIGGLIGYAKEEIFKWLLIKKVMHWDYRSLEEVSGIPHQTFVKYRFLGIPTLLAHVHIRLWICTI